MDDDQYHNSVTFDEVLGMFEKMHGEEVSNYTRKGFC